MAWSDLTNTQLIWVARNQKRHMMSRVNAEVAKPGSQLVADGKDGAPGITFVVALMVLIKVEEELKTRGIMPNDKRLGDDLVPWVACIKRDMMLGVL